MRRTFRRPNPLYGFGGKIVQAFKKRDVNEWPHKAYGTHNL